LVQSGFDVEILLGERQLTYLLLTLIDAGRIPVTFDVGDPPVTLGLRGPMVVDRTYEPHPDAPVIQGALDSLNPFQVEILFGHPTGADIRVHAVVDLGGLPIEGDLFITLTLETERDDAGMLERATLRVDLRDIESGIFPFVESKYHVDKATILAAMKEKVDRSVDLGGIGTFKRIQDLAFQKFDAEDGHPRALALYVNMRLQTGPEPESLMAGRGDIGAARNFLPEGSDAAMASRLGLYGDLAADGYHRFAEIDEDGNVSHPWRKSAFNPKSERIGSIIDVDVAPILNSNTLKIDVEVEYEIENFFDPNAHLVLELTPSTDGNGVMKWSINTDFHGSLAWELIGFIALAALVALSGGLFGLSFGAAIAAGIIGGSLGDFIGHAIVDEIYSGRVEKKADAALPDVISGRVEVAQRRWDPLYTTHHQIAMRPDGALVNANGVALWGKAVIDREVKPVAHAVIRDKKVQSPNPPTHLRYRVYDAEDFGDDFAAIAPGTDRRPIEQHDPVGEPTLYQLSIEQIVERLGEVRIVPDLAYIAKRIDMRQHQVHSILVISQREFNETRNALIGAFEEAKRAEIDANEGDQIRMDVEAEFAAAGETPTQEEFDARVQEVIDERVAPLTEEYIDGPLGAEVELALLPLLRFDLPPENLAALQDKKILHLLGLEIIKMRAPGHEGFMYYRDQPDFYKPDNLHSLPRYRETPNGPEIL
ncbi:MAG: hypothetical protein WKF28_01190, partial [Rubrobacteraceae bacterium]